MSRLVNGLLDDLGIESLCSSVYVQRSITSDIQGDSLSKVHLTSPNLILLFSWTGAQFKHIAKYVSGYNILFPATPVMVITTSMYDLIFIKSSKKRRSLFPAITTITSSPELSTKLLLHAFSEGGSYTAVQLAKAFLRATGRRLPVSALILDSCPGTLRIDRLASAGRATAPHNLTGQILASVTAYMVVASYYVNLLISDREGVLESLTSKTRRNLDNSTLWDLNVPRAYIFSKSDEIIDWKSVLAHAHNANEGGTPVFVEEFRGSGHCAHIKKSQNAERYWVVVKTTWRARNRGAVCG